MTLCLFFRPSSVSREMGQKIILTVCFYLLPARNDSVDLTVTSYSVSQLPKEDLEWALELLKSNMEAL